MADVTVLDPHKKRPTKRSRPLVQPRLHRFSRADHVELATTLVSDLGGADNVVFDELHPWRYDSLVGYWKQLDQAEASCMVQTYAGEPIGTGTTALSLRASDVSGTLKLAFAQVRQPDFFTSARAGLVFQNGFVEVSSTGASVRPLDRDFRARGGYPFPFQTGALPQLFLGFLGDLFRDDADRVEKELFIQEFFGACALGIAPRFQKACIGLGEGANGKSTMVDILIGCMPQGTTTAIPPQDWGQEYRRALLVGKHLNAVGELPERDILASEAFKAIIAGDPIVGRVIRESPAMLRPKAGHFFAANALPGTPDQTKGFWRRFAVLTFNRNFEGDPSRDPNIAAKVLAERPIIVSWLVEGAVRLLRQSAYTIPSSQLVALEEWRRDADQVALFVDDEVRPLRDDEELRFGTSGAALYTAFRRWAEKNGHRAMANNKFATRMKLLGLGARKLRTSNIYPVALLTEADRVETGGR